MTEVRRGPLNHTLAEVDGRPTLGCIIQINPTPARPKTSILSPSQREVVEALESVRAPATALRLVEVLAARGIAHDRHTVGHCLSALAVHGLTRVVDYLPSRSGRGTRQILWARTETPIPAATRRSVIKVQTPKPVPCPDPLKPTPAQDPQPRALLTPDMSPAERIERIRAHFARALPRLRRDGLITHLHLREGQLRHRARD